MTEWQRHFFYKKEVWKTTWTLRLSVLVLLVVAALLTRHFWADHMGRSLVCEENSDHADALLVENFDPDYLVFKRAAALQSAGVASKVLVPILSGPNTNLPSASAYGILDTFTRLSKLTDVTSIPTRELEPISLNTARGVRDFLLKEHIQSVVVVAPGFRSRRSVLVYDAVFKPAG